MINVELDPRLPLPPVKGVEYKEETYKTLPSSQTGTEQEISIGDLTPDDTVLNPGPDTLLPPEQITVISQTSRMTDTGQTVVDVLIEVLDSPGAAEYEVRMAV